MRVSIELLFLEKQLKNIYIILTILHLTSGFMQLASIFMQLSAVGRRRIMMHFHCQFEGKM